MDLLSKNEFIEKINSYKSKKYYIYANYEDLGWGIIGAAVFNDIDSPIEVFKTLIFDCEFDEDFSTATSREDAVNFLSELSNHDYFIPNDNPMQLKCGFTKYDMGTKKSTTKMMTLSQLKGNDEFVELRKKANLKLKQIQIDFGIPVG
jgi:hypothetical protein